MKTEKAKHTETPWKAIAVYGGWDGVGSSSGEICKLSLNVPANAAFIVEACNNHDRLEASNKELLAACEHLRDLVRGLAGVPKPPSGGWDAWNEVLSVIAKAKEAKP